MTTEPGSEPSRSRGLLWLVVLLALAAAGALWGASGLTWAEQLFRGSFGNEVLVGLTGADLRPELVPMALASLAAVAAVLATGGWLRRVVGVLVLVAGAALAWRSVQAFTGGLAVRSAPSAPPGSAPVGEVAAQPYGPLLVLTAAVLLVVAGALVLLRAGRMPAMGAKYSAPGTAKRKSHDPDRQMWQDLDAGRDPTDDQDR
ncbi:Trp biosynthesis-associated membrane protein [Saccharopolyspora indica]|uniref:Trp biosynthesis-associated membrane protein n=1 Tax=Saccharopolyspora indica TaxID=1229659 RepID=UPI0022EAF06F|nr:Trp biosynthesis-associated membrane protein [Saccharopolyspora indica]MDA3643872.1 Trp biosynthesis-associated membrane protein [Saccharopolyspora indica]